MGSAFKSGLGWQVLHYGLQPCANCYINLIVAAVAVVIEPFRSPSAVGPCETCDFMRGF